MQGERQRGAVAAWGESPACRLDRTRRYDNAIPFESKTVEGKSAGLETFPGTPLVLNFFASWRDPGREEMPPINELAAKAGGNYPVLGIAVEDTRAAVTDYAKEARLPST